MTPNCKVFTVMQNRNDGFSLRIAGIFVTRDFRVKVGSKHKQLLYPLIFNPPTPWNNKYSHNGIVVYHDSHCGIF